MKIKFVFDWPQILDSFRTAGTLMMVQGLLFGFVVEDPQLLLWAKGSVLIGLCFWAGASFAKQLKGSQRGQGF